MRRLRRSGREFVGGMEVRHCELLPFVIGLWKRPIDDDCDGTLDDLVFLSALTSQRHRDLQVDSSVVVLAYPCRQPNFDTKTPAAFGTCEEARHGRRSDGRTGRCRYRNNELEDEHRMNLVTKFRQWTILLLVTSKYGPLIIEREVPAVYLFHLVPRKRSPELMERTSPRKRTVPQVNCPAHAAPSFRAAFLYRDHPGGIWQMGTQTTLASAQGRTGRSDGHFSFILISASAWGGVLFVMPSWCLALDRPSVFGGGCPPLVAVAGLGRGNNPESIQPPTPWELGGRGHMRETKIEWEKKSFVQAELRNALGRNTKHFKEKSKREDGPQKYIPPSPHVTDCRGRGNDQDSGGLRLPAPWLLPRIDDWVAAASLGPCAQLNSSQSLRPWLGNRDLLPALTVSARNRIPVSSRTRSRLQFLSSATFSGFAVLFALPSFSTATHHTHFFLHSSRPYPPISFSGLRSLFLRGFTILPSNPATDFG
jgi:hypothetical protein